MANEKGGGGGTGPSGTPSALERYLSRQKTQKNAPKSGAATLEERAGIRSQFKHTSDPLSIPRPDEKLDSHAGERGFSKPVTSEQPSSLGRWEKFAAENEAAAKGAKGSEGEKDEQDERDVFQKARLEDRADVRSQTQTSSSTSTQMNSMNEAVTSMISDLRVAPEVGTRLLALIIDWIIVGCLTVPMMRAVSALLSIAFGPIVERHIDGLDTVASCLVLYFYYGYFYSKKGASPGKMLFNLEVIDAETGKYLTPWKAFFREAIGKFVSLIPFGMGYIIAAFRQDRRALHDLLFDTNVVSKK